MKFTPDMAGLTQSVAYPPHLANGTMARFFHAAAARHPRREALAANGARLTFTEIDTRAVRIAAALAGRGIRRGDVVGTSLLDGVAMVELLIATAKLGATLLTMNWRLAALELAVIIADACPRAVFASGSFAQMAQAAATGGFFVIRDADPDGLARARRDRRRSGPTGRDRSFAQRSMVPAQPDRRAARDHAHRQLHLHPAQACRFNIVGTTPVVSGEVARNWLENNTGFAEIALKTVNDSTVTVGPGSKTVFLPHR